ncbi:MAG: 4-phosphoerythronate dehydrogenase PdxB [Tannerellaceae bacterium]|nr:4-phosphoerythronate dehydrogenase PdxB [Tannerellaceae bacterium]
MKVIADNTIPYLKGIAETFADVTYLSSEEFIPRNIKGADVLIVRSIDKCTREVLEGSGVKLIVSATIGYDHIDTAYCEEAGIAWRNAPGSNAASVAHYVLASLVSLSLREGISLKGKTIGIVGVGHVGTEVERLCSAYGMNTLLNDPPRAAAEGETGFVSLRTIAGEADMITFHVPLTDKGNYPTRHLAGESFFSMIKRRPWIINSSRGAVHDTKALLKAKREGCIGKLIIDCWEGEPEISKELLSVAAIATPHIAGFSADGKANATRMCLENMEAFFGIEIKGKDNVRPSRPDSPVIDLAMFPDHRLERAILTTFDPTTVDAALRKDPEQFELFRAHYNHPREFPAYRIENAMSKERDVAGRLGFRFL